MAVANENGAPPRLTRVVVLARGQLLRVTVHIQSHLRHAGLQFFTRHTLTARQRSSSIFPTFSFFFSSPNSLDSQTRPALLPSLSGALLPSWTSDEEYLFTFLFVFLSRTVAHQHNNMPDLCHVHTIKQRGKKENV